MCKLITYEYCVPRDRPLPKAEVERCEEWPELVAKSKKGDRIAKQQLKSHIERKHLPILLFCAVVQKGSIEADT